MRVLIAGCGYVGVRLGIRLARSGHAAWGLRRDPSILPDEIRPVAADLLDPQLAARLPEVDLVVYAASADRSTPEAYRRAYVDGVANLQAALERRGDPVRRFIFVSSTAVYGDTGGGWVDEETPPAPVSFRGEEVRRGEEIVQSGTPGSVVLRLGGIYGPGRSRLVERVRSGEARCPDGGPRWTNRIHRDDAAGALEHLLLQPDPEPLYLGVDEEPVPICEVYRTLATMLGVPEPGVGAGDDPPGPNRRCSSRRLRESGYRFRYPTFREGYGRMLRDAGKPPDGAADGRSMSE